MMQVQVGRYYRKGPSVSKVVEIRDRPPLLREHLQQPTDMLLERRGIQNMSQYKYEMSMQTSASICWSFSFFEGGPKLIPTVPRSAEYVADRFQTAPLLVGTSIV